MARGLVRRIFDHAFASGWLARGDVVVDPFGGIGSTGIEAASRGCRAFLVELEPRFVALAEQNFALHRRAWEACGDPLPVIVQGDSRRLCAVLGPVLADCVVSSPPYAESLSSQTNGIDLTKAYRQPGKHGQHADPCNYGMTEGQLGAMKAGDVAAVIGSPDYVNSDTQPTKLGEGKGTRQDGDGAGRNKGDYLYSTAEGKLGSLPVGDVDAVVSSPPWQQGAEGGVRADKWSDPAAFLAAGRGHGASDAARLRQMERDNAKTYGSSAGQLGVMPAGSLADAVVSSPPFRQQQTGGGIAAAMNGGDYALTTGKPGQNCGYQKQSDSDANLAGEKSDDTFWSAARIICEQAYQILRPGGVAVWVVKAFCRNGAIVDFPGDWRRLCEACGFEFVEEIHASLVKRTENPGLFGEPVVKSKARKSFFRRLHEAKRPDLAIDFEVVLIVRKPNTKGTP